MGEEEGSGVNCWRGLTGMLWREHCPHKRQRCPPPVAVQALVVDGELLGYDLLLGMDSIMQLSGITVNGTGNIRFSRHEKRVCAAITLAEADFHAEYDRDTNAWTVSWKWSGDRPPISLRIRLSEYPPPVLLREQFEEELQAWIDGGWLRPYPEDKLGPPSGLIPLMAVLQENEQKVQPIMDYRELNKHVDPYMAGADVCAHKLREWRQQGSDMAILDLCRANLQIRMEKLLWPFQTVEIKGTRYCLTRLGFSLNVAPSIMTAIMNAIQQDEAMRQATSSYIDDIFVNEGILSAQAVKEHFESFELTCKEPECLRDGAKVLGLRESGSEKGFRWRRGGDVPGVPSNVMRWSVFSVCGKLVGHYPVCGWLRLAVVAIKQRTTSISSGWDDEVCDAALQSMLTETVARVTHDDPVRGNWCVDGNKFTVWVDASLLALRVALAVDEFIIEP